MSAADPSSVLLIRASSLGDIVQALPIAFALHEEGLRIGWVVEERFARLFELVPIPIEVLVWRRGLAGLRSLRGKGRVWDRVVDLQGNWKSAMLGLVLAGRRVLRAHRSDLREASSAWLPARSASPAEQAHVLARSWHLLREALPERFAERPAEALPGPPFLAVEADRLRPLEGALPSEPCLLVVLGASEDPRTWPLERALELRDRTEGPLRFLAGPREADLALPPDLPVIRQSGKDLGELVALGALMRARGGMALGHDGGAMHLLRASGARSLFLFGPQDPARTGPFGEKVLIREGHLPCRPCLSRSCRLDEGPICMSDIEVDKVLQTLQRQGGTG